MARSGRHAGQRANKCHHRDGAATVYQDDSLDCFFGGLHRALICFGAKISFGVVTPFSNTFLNLDAQASTVSYCSFEVDPVFDALPPGRLTQPIGGAKWIADCFLQS
jgi:hypothetical protein